ncbi:ABC transporter ATP-binding protein [bacterium]|nr:ABC transporter ATP-binding protein [bacterium]
MIRLENLSLAIDDKTILGPLNLQLQDGEWTALTGGNGSGKSTLCRIVAGLNEPTEGSLFVDSVSSGFTVPTGIAMQNPDSQFITTTVKREILFGMENLGLREEEQGKRLTAALDAFNLQYLLTRNPHTLSGGEKQRLLLASVWVMNPRHLILDEPLSFLDEACREDFVRLVEDLFYNRGVTVLWATLSPDEIPRSSRVIYLRKGRVSFDGSPEDFKDITSEEIITRKSLTPYKEDEKSRSSAAEETEYSDKRGEFVGFQSDSGIEYAVIIEDALISHDEGDFSLRIESLGVRKGEAVGITGPNGCGKTTLLLACAGLLPARKGRVSVLGKNIVSTGDFQPGRVAVLFQTPEEGFFASSVEEEVALGYRTFKGEEGVSDAVEIALDAVGLNYSSFKERNPFYLSQGEKRLCAIASVIIFSAQLYLFDEPALFLDGKARKRIISTLNRLTGSGATLIVVSHDREFLDAVTGRVVVL